MPLAIASTVFGVLGLTCLPVLGPVLALVFARAAAREGEGGRLFARVGRVLGWLGIAEVVAFGAFFAWLVGPIVLTDWGQPNPTINTGPGAIWVAAQHGELSTVTLTPAACMTLAEWTDGSGHHVALINPDIQGAAARLHRLDPAVTVQLDLAHHLARFRCAPTSAATPIVIPAPPLSGR